MMKSHWEKRCNPYHFEKLKGGKGTLVNTILVSVPTPVKIPRCSDVEGEGVYIIINIKLLKNR